MSKFEMYNTIINRISEYRALFVNFFFLSANISYRLAIWKLSSILLTYV